MVASQSLDSWTLAADVAGIVAAGAAIVTLIFASRAIADARRLNRENRLSRVADRIGGFGATFMRVLTNTGDEAITSAAVVRLQLEAAIGAAGQELPACKALASIDHLTTKPPLVKAALEAALEEVHGALGRHS
jgi:hypothetical protein